MRPTTQLRADFLAFNAAVRRSREEYEAHPFADVAGTCACGRRMRLSDPACRACVAAEVAA